MSSGNLLSEIKKQFGRDNLYEVFEITKDATKAEIKKAYYKLSLQVHPDRVTDKEKAKATKKFQVLGKIYSLLQDDNRRAVYNETGTIDEDSEDLNKNWYDYWRLLFPPINLKDIDEFEKYYKGSDKELEDLKEVYTSCGGDLDVIMDSMMCSTTDDEPRFRAILASLIDAGQIDDFDAFKNEKKKKTDARRRKAAVEEVEAEEMLKKMQKRDGGDLAAMIRSNQKSRAENTDSFLAQMEAKYCTAKKPASGARKKSTAK